MEVWEGGGGGGGEGGRTPHKMKAKLKLNHVAK